MVIFALARKTTKTARTLSKATFFRALIFTRFLKITRNCAYPQLESCLINPKNFPPLSVKNPLKKHIEKSLGKIY